MENIVNIINKKPRWTGSSMAMTYINIRQYVLIHTYFNKKGLYLG
ncbi:uncharacterized protein METZ01_LOCUS111391 [marine metagenome]|uniref:Uncharacterized protein n=1 Tax=marine metagenome TaxID=408172 RepID=A0A381X2Z2_9ZZZZ